MYQFWRDFSSRPQFMAHVRSVVPKRSLAEDSLRESDERFRFIANSAPVMIWMSDAEKQVTYLNQTWLDYTDWPVDAALGYRWVEILHPDDLERCRDLYKRRLSCGSLFGWSIGSAAMTANIAGC